MKLNNLTKGVIAFSTLSILASGALMASAATDTAAASTANAVGNGRGRGLAKEARIRPENMTEAQKAAVEARRTEMETKMTAVKAALTASDYNAWVAAEKAINEDCPMLTKVTADNFSKYAEAMKLRFQADTIMKDLGIDGPGMGLGLGMGMGRGNGQAQK